MDTTHVLATIQAAGMTLRPEGGRLIAAPADRLTDELRALIRAHKTALLGLLSANEPLTPDPDALSDPAAEARRQAVLAVLRDHPEVRRAYET